MTTPIRIPALGAMLLALAVWPAGAQTPPKGGKPAAPPTAAAKLPPVIDREVFFGDPEYAGAQVSPDGRFISFLKTNSGQLNVWVKRTEEPFAAAKPITADSKRPVTGYFWSRDGKYILYVQDKGGDENWHVYAVDPEAPAAADTKVPPARDLTPYGKVQAQIVDVPKKTPGQILVALNDRDAAKHDVYRIDVVSGQRELLFRNDENVAGWTVDLDGRLRMASRVAANGLGTEVLRVDGDKLVPMFTLTCDVFRSCSPIQFHKDGRRVYVVTADPGEDLTHLALYDLESGKWERVESDPEKQVDFGGLVTSRATDEVVATYYVGDRLRIYPKDAQTVKDLQLLRKALGDGDIYPGSSTLDDRLQIVSVTSDVDPGATYLYNRGTGKVELLYRPYPKLPSRDLARMKPVKYKARDGLEIPAYLTVPKGVAARNLPAIVLPHGGPWGRDAWGYDAIAQFLANRGYAVLMPNFRGSTGYGQRFLDLGNKQWGTGTMQHDITDGVKWLIQQGIADPKRVGIMGGSYGGFATLAGVAFTPELYAAGVDIVGPSNIQSLLKTIPPYWAPIKKAFDVRVGDPANPEDAARLKEQSPLFAANRIRAPLLVIQGANDPRVNKAESDQIVAAVRDLKRPVEYLVAPDEGHGYRERVNRIAMFAAIEKFLAAHLGGRYQQSMPEEIGKRLAAITVNVDTVKVPAATAQLKAAPASFSGDAVKPGTCTYAQTIEAMGRTLAVTATVAITASTYEGRPAWLFVQGMEGDMGTASDTLFVDRSSLAPLRRIIHQGPANVEMTFRGDSVVGQISAGPQQMPIRAKVEPPVYVDGGALEAGLATLPLAPGFTASLRTFDMMMGSAKEQNVNVTGAEHVKVAAGEFDAWRVELKPVDGSAGGSVFWIEQAAPHRIVKGEATLPPQSGGGKAVAELKSAS